MGVAKSMTLRGGGGGGPTLSVTMTLIFPKIVWTCPLTCFRIFFVDFLVHTVKQKPIIKGTISGKLVTNV